MAGLEPAIAVDRSVDVVVAFDAGDLHLHDMERVALGVAAALPCVRDVCTHVVPTSEPHYAATVALDGAVGADEALAIVARLVPGAGAVAWSRWGDLLVALGPESAVSGATAALAARRDRVGGRAIMFSGQDRLTGTVRVGELLAWSDIEGVDALGLPTDPETPVVTREFVRPSFRDGHLVLVLRPRSGAFGCFEQPDPTPCCAGHGP